MRFCSRKNFLGLESENEIDSKDKALGQTPLSWSATNGHEAVVKLLLDTIKVDIHSIDRLWDQTPLL
jgi:ankyrin repeat protein